MTTVARNTPSRPHVVVVLLDDLGFGGPSLLGGPCSMPTAEALAGGGLSYTQFHVTAMCSPTRQSLLTGRNHHAVGMGAITEIATADRGYNALRPDSAAPLAQILGEHGYATAAFGKWHQTPVTDLGPDGPYDRWPTGEGFEHFYGFMGAEADHWRPLLFHGTRPVEPASEPGYHLSEDLVDRAIEWIDEQRRSNPQRPTFTYLSFGALHAPYHVAPEWRDRYRGRFDHGWDRERADILARQLDRGVVPPGTVLSPWPAEVPHWDDLDVDARRVAAALMETFAGFAEHTDAQVGRFVAALAARRMLDDTLFIYLLGDNGTTGEGGITGSVNAMAAYNGEDEPMGEMLARLDDLGGPSTLPMLPVGWALALNTPYQWTKMVASHYGGTRTGAVVHWPAGITARGELRHQWHHVIDVVPTVLEAAGLEPPDVAAGVAQAPLDGVSMRYTFDDATAADRRTTQYFEMLGNRGIYHEGWTAVAKHRAPWEPNDDHPFDDDRWELYDTTTDWSQATDVAVRHPERLAALQARFADEATRNHALPLVVRAGTWSDRGAGEPVALLLTPTMRRLSEHVVPNLKNRTHAITAALVAGGDDRGVVVAQGGRFGGWTVYLVDGCPTYEYNHLGRRRCVVRSAMPLAGGEHLVVATFAYAGDGLGGAATLGLTVDGADVGSARIERTARFRISTCETLDVGVDLGTAVSPDYDDDRNNAFTGEIRWVRLDVAPAGSAIDPRHLLAGQ